MNEQYSWPVEHPIYDRQETTTAFLNIYLKPFKRHLKTKKDQVAFIWEGDEIGDLETITYGEFHKLVSKFSNVLKQANIAVGEPVVIYLPCCIIVGIFKH